MPAPIRVSQRLTAMQFSVSRFYLSGQGVIYVNKLKEPYPAYRNGL